MEGGTPLWIGAGSCRQCRPAPWTSWSRRPRLRWSRRWPRSSCLCTCRSSLTQPAVRLSLCWGKPEGILLYKKSLVVFTDLPVSGLFVWGPCCLSTAQFCLYSLLYQVRALHCTSDHLEIQNLTELGEVKAEFILILPGMRCTSNFKCSTRSTFELLTQIHYHNRIYPVNPIRNVWKCIFKLHYQISTFDLM